jgi:hypothetical protein
MTWKGTTPTFESYTHTTNVSGTTDGRFVLAGSEIPAEPESSYAAPFNQIVIVVKASDLGLKPGDAIVGFLSAVSQTTNPVGTGPGATALYDQMPNSPSFAKSYVVPTSDACSAPGFVSRKTHGAAGAFDVLLPTSGNPGIECRTGGANNLYTLIYSLDKDVAIAGTATKTQGAAIVGVPIVGPNPNQVTVNLRSVMNAQHLVITLNGVQDVTGATLNNLAARMDVLIGDVDGNGRVDGNDVSAVQGHTRQSTDSTNYRYDVDATGRIDGNDVSITQTQTRTGLP